MPEPTHPNRAGDKVALAGQNVRKANKMSGGTFTEAKAAATETKSSVATATTELAIPRHMRC